MIKVGRPAVIFFNLFVKRFEGAVEMFSNCNETLLAAAEKEHLQDQDFALDDRKTKLKSRKTKDSRSLFRN
jgi:hypothetical protein